MAETSGNRRRVSYPSIDGHPAFTVEEFYDPAAYVPLLARAPRWGSVYRIVRPAKKSGKSSP